MAGLAVAWNLLAAATPASPVRICLYDKAGIAGGASGASAGLLHPLTPKGKVTTVWKVQIHCTFALPAIFDGLTISLFML